MYSYRAFVECRKGLSDARDCYDGVTIERLERNVDLCEGQQVRGMLSNEWEALLQWSSENDYSENDRSSSDQNLPVIRRAISPPVQTRPIHTTTTPNKDRSLVARAMLTASLPRITRLTPRSCRTMEPAESWPTCQPARIQFSTRFLSSAST